MKPRLNGHVTKMKPIDLSPLFHDYEGQWVALTEYTPNYKVICNGKKVETVYKKALDRGYKNPVIFKITPELTHAIL